MSALQAKPLERFRDHLMFCVKLWALSEGGEHSDESDAFFRKVCDSAHGVGTFNALRTVADTTPWALASGSNYVRLPLDHTFQTPYEIGLTRPRWINGLQEDDNYGTDGRSFVIDLYYGPTPSRPTAFPLHDGNMERFIDPRQLTEEDWAFLRRIHSMQLRVLALDEFVYRMFWHESTVISTTNQLHAISPALLDMYAKFSKGNVGRGKTNKPYDTSKIMHFEPTLKLLEEAVAIGTLLASTITDQQRDSLQFNEFFGVYAEVNIG